MSTPRLTEIFERQQRFDFQAQAEQGKLFGFNYSLLDGSFDISAPVKILFRVGAKKVHLRRCLEVFGGSATLIAYRTPTVTGVGTAIPIYNQNDDSTIDPLLTVFVGPTTTANGTQCFEPSVIVGGANIVTKSTASIGDKANRILKANTDYLVIITAAADNELLSYSTEFIED
jgi:hypothetical protein